jgi:succinyl-diaminopimelate desuccinylase
MTNTSLINEIKHKIAGLSTELMAVTSRLVQFPTVVPPGYIDECVAYAQSYFQQRGMETALHQCAERKPNLCATIPGKRPGKILWLGHLDVVPEGDHTAWKHPPFSGAIEGNRVYGRGATDMKGSCAAAMVAATVLHALAKGEHPTVEVWLTADEEIGGQDGAKWLAEAGKLQGDVCVIGDASGGSRDRPTMELGCKGGMATVLKARGVTAHGSQPYLGSNAIEKLLTVIPYVKKIREFPLDVPVELASVLQSSIDFLLAEPALTPEQREGAKRLYHYPTVSLNIIQGGVKRNVVPDSAEATFDIRITPGCSIPRVRDRMLELLKESGVEGITADINTERGGFYVSPQHPAVIQFRKTITMLMGKEPLMKISTGGTDGVSVHHIAHIPCVTYGPLVPGVAHTPNEYITMENLVMATEVFATFPLVYTQE